MCLHNFAYEYFLFHEGSRTVLLSVGEPYM